MNQHLSFFHLEYFRPTKEAASSFSFQVTLRLLLIPRLCLDRTSHVYVYQRNRALQLDFRQPSYPELSVFCCLVGFEDCSSHPHPRPTSRYW